MLLSSNKCPKSHSKFALTTDCYSGVVVEKHSDELFALDTVGDAAIKKAYNKIHKPLKADEILAQRSAVPAVDSRKRAASKVTDGVLEPTSKRRRGGGVSYKELERLKRLAYGGESVQKDVIQEPGLVGYDPWAEDAQSEPKQSDANFSFLQPPKPIKPPKTLKRAPISLAANGRDIPAVQKPKPEASYNPQSTDYLEAFIREAEKEAVAEQRRVDEAEAEKQQLAKAAAIAAEKSEDDDIGLGLGDEESAWEGIESEGEVNALLSQKRPQRKTKAQRNKIARRKEAERKAAMEAQVKAREQQAARARAIAKEIEARERAKTAALTTSDESNREPGDDAVLRRRQLGRAPYVILSAIYPNAVVLLLTF